ncbi:MAG: AMP-binding protein [Dermatophilaceae bacterium]
MPGSLVDAVDRYAAGLAPEVARVVQAAAGVPALADRLAGSGITAADIAAGDLRTLAVETKDDLLARQRQAPPFGGLLEDPRGIRRVFQSPGPIYEPQFAGADPWRWGPALRAAGFDHADVVLNCFGYHLSPAGAMFEEAALALGAAVLPGGIGNQDLQASAIADLGVTAYTGLPSYLKALVDHYDAQGLDPQRWRVAKALVTAEPLPDSLRTLLRERVPTVLMAYGTAETGLIGYETEPGGGLVPAPGVCVQVCDLDSGLPLAEGEGQVVVTLLRAEYPLVRFGTGDLSAWTLGPDGQPRLVGVLGRVGAAVKVRGMFLHPRQASAVMAGVPGIAAWRFLVDRHEHRDELSCEVVPSDGASAERVVAEVGAAVRAGLRFACPVTVVDALPEDGAPITDRRDWS